MLAPVCLGVVIVSYFDTLAASSSSSPSEQKETNFWGVVFAFAALGASAIYTVWIGKYHRTLECSSMQLLMNQAPVSVAVMVYVVPFTDDVTGLRGTGMGNWGLIFVVSFFLSLFLLCLFGKTILLSLMMGDVWRCRAVASPV